jgi:hypothetical protein
MAVVVRQKVVVAGAEMWLESYLPDRSLSLDERVRADRLDEYLAREVPLHEGRVAAEESGEESLVRKWYALGRLLREVIAASGLVMSADIDSGDFWKAMWQYLPRTLRPSGPGGDLATYEVGHKRKDHLSLCYEISAHPWDSVAWIRRWDDWHQISFRPTISRDPRVLAQLGESICAAGRYPTRQEFRSIVKALGDRFPTRRMVNTEVLCDEDVTGATRDAVDAVLGREGRGPGSS